MTATQEIALIHTSEATSTHEDWLSLMRIGMTTLLQEPRLLAELIWGEAARQAARQAARHQSMGTTGRGTSNEAVQIFNELRACE